MSNQESYYGYTNCVWRIRMQIRLFTLQTTARVKADDL